MRRCVVCVEKFELSSANFALTKRGWAYICVTCKGIDNAIRYRRKRLAGGRGAVKPFAEQERRIILEALSVTCGKVDAAAKLLQIGRATIYRKIEDYRAAGTFTLDTAGPSVLRRELEELEEKWAHMIRRAKILRKREARQRAFARKLDHALRTAQAERRRTEARRLRDSLDRSARHAMGRAQGKEARRRPSKLPVVALRAAMDQELAGPLRLLEEERRSPPC